MRWGPGSHKHKFNETAPMEVVKSLIYSYSKRFFKYAHFVQSVFFERANYVFPYLEKAVIHFKQNV